MRSDFKVKYDNVHVGSFGDTKMSQHRIEKYVNAITPIAEGERNGSLYSLGLSLRTEFGLTGNALETALSEINHAKCTPSLPENEVKTILLRTVMSACRYSIQGMPLNPRIRKIRRKMGNAWGMNGRNVLYHSPMNPHSFPRLSLEIREWGLRGMKIRDRVPSV